ncbi:MAG: aldehyde dehydrogenase family protein, partial [Bdellovibrionaceae bacterium]|nr:aldehyde dehydrogenase family protein [Pseudobdellovibrionaceae bacterium]
MNKEWTIYNTHTGQKIKNYQYADEASVFQSLEKLHGGFVKWRQLPLKTRQQKMLNAILIAEKDKDHLASVIALEMGKSLDSAQAEVRKCIETSKYLCGLELNFLESHVVKNTTYDHSVVSYESIGVIVSILPWNFPAWQGFRAFFPTMLAGNAILLKHSEVTPTVGDLLQSYFEQAGLGDVFIHKLFNHEITEKIIADSRVDGVSITGSVKAGQLIAGLCSKYFKKCVLELGGSDPSIVLADADLEKTCKTISRSRLQNAGQVCISAKRALVPKPQLHQVIELFKTAFTEIMEAKPALVGPLADARFKADYNQTVNELKKYSQVVFEKDLSSLNTNEHQAFVNPCILLFDHHHEILQNTEVFGPCLIVIPYENLAEAVQMANATVFGLGASVY